MTLQKGLAKAFKFTQHQYDALRKQASYLYKLVEKTNFSKISENANPR